MVLRTYLGDRRVGRRFQINGQLWGSVDVIQDVVFHDITSAGALLEMRLSRGMQSLRAAVIRPEGGPEVLVHVRHLSPMTDSPEADRFLVGVEFVKPSGAARHALDALIRTWKQSAPRSS